MNGEKDTVDKLPSCSKCTSEYTYEYENLLVCPECAYEWTLGRSLSIVLYKPNK